MDKKEELGIRFSFDNLDILGVFKDKVYLRGTYYNVTTEDFKDEICVIVISSKLFHKSLDLWLKDKKNYCENWNHFCGVMGTIEAVKYKELDKTNLLVDFDERTEKCIYKDVRTFEVKSFQNSCDMEHG